MLLQYACFLYVDDLTEYRDSRNLFWNLSNNEIEHVSNNKKITPGIDVELPFDIARNNEELKKCILQFDKTRYIDNVMKFKRNIRLVFNGDASGEVANVIIKRCQENRGLIMGRLNGLNLEQLISLVKNIRLHVLVWEFKVEEWQIFFKLEHSRTVSGLY